MASMDESFDSLRSQDQDEKKTALQNIRKVLTSECVDHLYTVYICTLLICFLFVRN
jgi:hypothetical protein